MAVSSGDIRTGGAYVEITADDSPMMRRLAETRARLERWVAESNRIALTRGTEASLLGENKRGFLSGSLRGGELFKTGFKLAAAIASVRVAVKDAQIFSSLFRGDMEGARKATEELPFGLGQIAKELAGPVDAAAQKFVFRLRGLDVGDIPSGLGGAGKKDRTEAIERYNRGIKAVEALQQAYRKAAMSARELAAAEVEAMNLSAGGAAKALALHLKIIEADEARKQAVAIKAKGTEGDRLIAAEFEKFAKLTMSERDFLAYQVRQEGLSEEKADSLLRLREANLEVTEEQKRAQEALNALMAEAEADAQAWVNRQQEAVDADQKRYDDAYDLTQAMRAPREKAGDEITKYREMIEQGLIDPETYRRAVRATIEDLAAALPEAQRPTTGAGGTFSGVEAYRMGSSGGIDRIAIASEATARNTDRLIKLTKELGVVYH